MQNHKKLSCEEMPDELKMLLEELPLPVVEFRDHEDVIIASQFVVTTIPDPEIGNGPMKISRWLIKTYRVKAGDKVHLTNY